MSRCPIVVCCFLLGLILSCKEAIDLHGQYDEKLVIEGEVNEGAGPHYVKISKTVPFNNSRTFVPENVTHVIIMDSKGNTDTLQRYQNRSGIYVSHRIVGIRGRNYFLKVNYQGKEYVAESTMPEGLELDTVYSEYILKPEDRIVVGRVKNDKLITGYYRYYVRNAVNIVSTHYVYESYTLSSQILYLLVDRELHSKNDSIEFVFFSIDKPNYDYFKTLAINQATSNSNLNPNISFSNPNSNITGPDFVLGYFSAHTRSSYRAKI